MLNFAVALISLFLIFPVLLMISFLILFNSPGPIIYKGRRIGLNGKEFHIYKFRTMISNADNIGASSTSSNDLRITSIGKILRKYKLDELPQLLNILLGAMSFVGPRPEVKKFTEMYNENEKRILSVKPGITDWASIKYHNEGEIIEKAGIKDYDEAYARLIRPGKIKLQLKYIDENNLYVDINILILTIMKLFKTRLARGK
jgi:lipopolysaccharide/colanic/teichoic acid biosynthesis glycosyltransferase